MAIQSVTKAAEFDHAHLKAQVRDSLPVIDRACSAQEIELLLAYREASEADKRRLMKLLNAALAGLLPPPEVSSKWTLAQRRAFADDLPEVSR